MDAEIISVGDELLLGMIADTNSAWLSSTLAAHGIAVARHTAVGDDLNAVQEAVEEATQRAGIVIVNGGIGPTVDDVTRQAVAAAAGSEMRLDDGWLSTMQAKFLYRNIPMPQSNVVQAMIPLNATLINNPVGTAAGFFMKINGAEVSVFPGVPAELKAMFEHEYLPQLILRVQTGRALVTRTLKCFGMPESLINEKIAHLMGAGKNPQVGLLAKDAVISVKITASAENERLAMAMIDQAKQEVRAILGRAVFGDDDDCLETAIARLLTGRGRTVCTAESCTGGIIAQRLTNVSGSSRYFLGGVVSYSNGSKTDFLGVPEHLFREVGAVSPEVARAMAEGVRRRMGADYALAVTGIAGPTGGTPDKPVGLVYLALSDAAGTEVQELRLSGARDVIRDRSSKFAMEMLRAKLISGG